MSKLNSLIIVGGGSSIKEGITLGLWDKLEGQFTCGLNLSSKCFNPTFTCIVDAARFLHDYIDFTLSLPLVILRNNDNFRKKYQEEKLIWLKDNSNLYTRDLKQGVYTGILCGVFALSLAIYLLDVGNIFLLGADFGSITQDKEDVTNKNVSKRNVIINGNKLEREITHFYQGEIEHPGIGRNGYFKKTDPNKLFEPFKNEQQCKIYNVSPNSRIDIFEKINYQTFFSLLEPSSFNQDELRQFVSDKLQYHKLK